MKQIFIVEVEDNRDPSKYQKLSTEDVATAVFSTIRGTEIRLVVTEQVESSSEEHAQKLDAEIEQANREAHDWANVDFTW